MTNYSRGRKLEYAARDELIIRGYIIVIRSAGSKGPFDLVALSPSDVVLIQVSKKGVKRKADIEKLRKIQVQKHVRKELWEKIQFKGWDVTEIEDERA